jgi:O-acetyl-ADP-ribose deacetylase (regulator of RNase III)
MIEIVRGDITSMDVDAIVNAANERMLGGGGVDGAIHKAAGAQLYKACLTVPEVRSGVRCPTGQSRITPGFNLPARYVIHSVGPVWRGGRNGEGELLASCYRSALMLARRHHLRSVAFPAISCGAYGYPLDAAAAIALRETSAHVTDFDRLMLVAFDEDTYEELCRSERSERSDRSAPNVPNDPNDQNDENVPNVPND